MFQLKMYNKRQKQVEINPTIANCFPMQERGPIENGKYVLENLKAKLLRT